MIISIFYVLQYLGFQHQIHQTLWINSMMTLHSFRYIHNDVVFHLPETKIIYVLDYVHLYSLTFGLFLIYLAYFLYASLGANDLDCNKADYRMNVKYQDRQEFRRKLIARLFGVPVIFSLRLVENAHNLESDAKMSKSNTYWDRLFLICFPRIVRYLFVINFPYQHLLVGVGQSPAVDTRAGKLFINYNTGGV